MEKANHVEGPPRTTASWTFVSIARLAGSGLRHPTALVRQFTAGAQPAGWLATTVQRAAETGGWGICDAAEVDTARLALGERRMRPTPGRATERPRREVTPYYP